MAYMRILSFIVMIIISVSCSSGKNKQSNNERTKTMKIKDKQNEVNISGIWAMDDHLLMCKFLKIEIQSGYCMEISKDEKNCKIYFLEYLKNKKFYEAKVNHLGDNIFELVYLKKKRKFTLSYNESDAENKVNNGYTYLHFNDSRPYPTPKNKFFAFDGTHFKSISKDQKYKYSINGYMKYLKVILEMTDLEYPGDPM